MGQEVVATAQHDLAQQEAHHDTRASRALTTAQYQIVFGYLRDHLPLSQLAGDPAFLHSFPAAQLPDPMHRVLDAALAEGDSVEGFLVRLKQPLLVALVRRISHPRSPMDWEDLLQDSRLHVIVVLRRLATGGVLPDGNVEGYLYRAVVNGLRDLHRRAGRQEQRETPVSVLVEESDEGDGEENEEWLSKAFLASDGGQYRATQDDPSGICGRRAFWEEVETRVGPEATALLAEEHVAQTPQAEIAARLGVTTRTVRNRLDRARRRLLDDRAFRQEYA